MTEPRGGEAMTTGGVFDVSHCRTALRAVLVSIIVEMPVARFALRTMIEAARGLAEQVGLALPKARPSESFHLTLPTYTSQESHLKDALDKLIEALERVAYT
jgi:hypothetical protein